MTEAIIVFNSGSTSLKFGAYALDANKSLPLLRHGSIDGMQADPHFIANDAAGKPLDAHAWGKGAAIDHKAAMQFVIAWLEANLVKMKTTMRCAERISSDLRAPACPAGLSTCPWRRRT